MTAAIIAVAALGLAAVSLGILLYRERGLRDDEGDRATEQAARATAASLQNADLAVQLQRADASRADLLRALNDSRDDTDKYRRLYLDALTRIPGASGGLMVELGGGLPAHQVPPGSATEDRDGDESGAVPEPSTTEAPTVPSRPAGGV